MGGSRTARRSTGRAGIVFSLIALLAGCYTLQPVSGVAPPGTRVAYDINDVGRVALGGAVGPEIGMIEGRLVSTENNESVLAVTSVKYLRGGQQIWSGERVAISKDYVSNSYIRRYSKGRTAVLAATIVGGVVYLAVSQDLLGLGKGEPPVIPPDSTPSFGGRRPR